MTATFRRLSLHRVRSRLGDPESGTVTAFVVVFMLALLVMAGLVLDGGLALSAKIQAIDDAQAAARAGAQAIDVPLYRSTGEVTLDPAQATSDAEAFLTRAGRTGTVSVTGDQVTVTVTITQPTQILSLVGIASLTETGVSGSAVWTSVGGATRSPSGNLSMLTANDRTTERRKIRWPEEPPCTAKVLWTALESVEAPA
ncbi:MAG: hypothetical protein M0Z95_09775, partial [Actinomycetota bacterium]|nr:hypothetical protein [Actinomycetota bacterium]